MCGLSREVFYESREWYLGGNFYLHGEAGHDLEDPRLKGLKLTYILLQFSPKENFRNYFLLVYLYAYVEYPKYKFEEVKIIKWFRFHCRRQHTLAIPWRLPPQGFPMMRLRGGSGEIAP